MAKRDYYDVLGVSKDVSESDLKRTYRKLSKKYHPDINKAADAADKFKEITEAYEVLSDPQKRAAYDQYGHASTDPNFGAGFGGGFGGGFEDIFSSFFGGGAGRRNPNAPRQGADLQYVIHLSFEEAIFGKQETIKYHREKTCHTCEGSGAKPGTSPVSCSRCHGSGHIQVEQNSIFGRVMAQQVCPVCQGSGQEIKEKCPTCHGRGREEEVHKVKVTIPAGVDDGQQMRLSGQGEAGVNGGPYGDLFVMFRVSPSKQFIRNGENIHYVLPLDFAQATLGDEVNVPTVHGDVSLKIPSGTQAGAKFRLREKGVPRLNGHGHGDQYVEISIKIPKKLNEEQREALHAYLKASNLTINEDKQSFFDKVKDAFKD